MDLTKLTTKDIILSNPVGSDWAIKQHQIQIKEQFKYIDVILGAVDHISIPKTADITIQFKLNGTDDYISIFPDDRLNFAFFDMSNEKMKSVGLYMKEGIFVVFMNLRDERLIKLYPDLKDERNTGLIIQSFEKYFRNCQSFGLNKTITVFDTVNIFKNWNFVWQHKANFANPINTADMHPYLLLGFRFELTYQYSNC